MTNPYGDLSALLAKSPTDTIPGGTDVTWKQLPNNPGLNVIAIPGLGSNGPSFELIQQDYTETIDMQNGPQNSPTAGGTAPNHGLPTAPGPDSLQTVGAITYNLFVNDAASPHGQLHFENGMWLNLPVPDPASPTPVTPEIARLFSVPHGNSGMTKGAVPIVVKGGPTFQEITILPSTVALPPDSTAHRVPADQLTDSMGNTPYVGLAPDVLNPNLKLSEAITSTGITIKQTTVLTVSTGFPTTDVLNTPFTEANVKPHHFSCIYCIEELSNGQVWLQYSQTILLEFNGLFWPHVDVNTVIL